MTFVIHNVKLIERFPVAANFTQVSKDVVYGPTLLDGNVFRGHSSSDRLLGISKQIGGYLALFRREQVEQFLGDRRGQFLEQGGPVVRRKVIDNLGDLFVAQCLDQLFLVLETEIFEDFRGDLAGQDAQQYSFVISLKVGKDFSQFGRGEAAKNFAQSSEI